MTYYVYIAVVSSVVNMNLTGSYIYNYVQENQEVICGPPELLAEIIRQDNKPRTSNYISLT